MATVKAHLDCKKPPRLSKETKARLDTLTDEQLTANALADPDNPPLTSKELKRPATARDAPLTRKST